MVLMFVGALRPSTLLRYCRQVFLFVAGSLPATYFPINPSTDDTAQKDHLNSDGQAINIPTVLTNKKRERST
jgi:hypothetical protein